MTELIKRIFKFTSNSTNLIAIFLIIAGIILIVRGSIYHVNSVLAHGEGAFVIGSSVTIVGAIMLGVSIHKEYQKKNKQSSKERSK